MKFIEIYLELERENLKDLERKKDLLERKWFKQAIHLQELNFIKEFITMKEDLIDKLNIYKEVD